MARMTAIAVGVLLALGLAGGSRAPEAPDRPVSLIVRPSILLFRGDARAEIRIARDVDNRAVDLAWASEHGQAGRTLRGIDGENGPALIAVELRDLVPAHYVFTATLYGQAGEIRGQARAEILAPDDGGTR